MNKSEKVFPSEGRGATKNDWSESLKVVFGIGMPKNKQSELAGADAQHYAHPFYTQGIAPCNLLHDVMRMTSILLLSFYVLFKRDLRTRYLRYLANRDLDDLADLEALSSDTGVGASKGVSGDAKALSNNEECVARLDGVGSRSACNAGSLPSGGDAGGVVGVANVDGDQKDLTSKDDVGVRKLVLPRNVADTRVVALRDGGQGLSGLDSGLVEVANLAASGRGSRGGGSGRSGCL